jgi:drug/metabolite transporter (DMT)-like permease
MTEHASKQRIVLAFGMVYLFWGSTFLAVHYAVQTIPALLMAGSRQFLAGLLLYPIARIRNKEKITIHHWLSGGLIGVLLVLGGNGSIAWVEARGTATDVTALLVGTVPMWMAIMDWLRPRGPRPTVRTVMGLVLGLAGMLLLVSPSVPMLSAGASPITPLCAVTLVGGSICWATGSILSRHLRLPKSPLLGTAIFTLCGGVGILLMGVLGGELKNFSPGAVSLHSALATLYLSVFGSIVGFSAYTFLLRQVSAARVATYAYVNPVIAVFLGWIFIHEALTLRMLLAAAIILAGVALVITAPHAPEEISGQPVVPE